MKPLFMGPARRLAARALANGGSWVGTSRSHIQWDISGSCQRPVIREMWSRTTLKNEKSQVVSQMGQFMRFTLECRCRKCPNCLRMRGRTWAYRAQVEYTAAARTWFGTLTLSPESHYTMLSRARHYLDQQGVDLDSLGSDEVFQSRHREISKEITLFLKRVRKSSEARLRFLLVAEAHESGLPHYHMLVHEVSAFAPVTYRQLSEQWSLGFSKWNLVKDKRRATYVTKYLNKDARARVRASLHYGAIPEPTEGERNVEQRRHSF